MVGVWDGEKLEQALGKEPAETVLQISVTAPVLVVILGISC